MGPLLVGGEQITSTKRNNKPKKWCFGPVRGKREKAVGQKKKKKTREIPQTWKSGSLKNAAFSHGPGSQRGHGSECSVRESVPALPPAACLPC